MEKTRAEALSEQIGRVRASDALGRSQGLTRLFEYLADPAQMAQTPREADVAQDVFGRALDLSGDASIRVYIHRLRRKLDAFYAADGAGESHRLIIPPGDYRLDVAPMSQAEAPRTPRARWLWPVLAAVLAMILANAGIWWAVARDAGPSHSLARLSHAPLWAGLGRDRPILVVVGDYYIFGDTGGGDEPQRMIRAFEINSPADLDAYLMDNPQFQGRYLDLDTYYTPVGATLALRHILPLVRQAAGRPDRISVITASHLSADMMKANDIVYVGYLSGLHLLQAPVFERSRFAVGATFDELVDRRSGQSYVSGAGAASGDRPNRDYGYAAAFSGPAGNRIVVVAGARDIGVVQMAEIVTDPVAAQRLMLSTKGQGEALYEVDGVGRTNVGAKAVAISP